MQIRSDRVSWREIDGEMVVLDLASSTYFTTNRTGTVLMRLLAQDQTPDSLAEVLVRDFDIPLERARTDVAAFLGALHDQGLLADALPTAR